MSGLALKVSSLCKVYNGDVKALDNFHMELKKGSILGLFGPNGAGKSTMVNILVNIVRKDSGEIYIYDEKIYPHSSSYKSRSGFVLEKPVYLEKLSVTEYLQFTGQMYRLTDKVIDQNLKKLLETFELEYKKDEWIENCSKGMRKKTSVCAALIHDPALLIFDEPFADLDLIAVSRLKEMFQKYKHKNRSILIVSHNIQEMENICDEIALIDKGMLQFSLSIEDIYEEMKQKKIKSVEAYMLHSLNYDTYD